MRRMSQESKRVCENCNILRGIQYSVLPTLTSEGIIALHIFEGSVMKDHFLTFIQE